MPCLSYNWCLSTHLLYEVFYGCTDVEYILVSMLSFKTPLQPEAFYVLNEFI